MKIEIVYIESGKTKTFETHNCDQALKFIDIQAPIKILAIRTSGPTK
jgi:hypothetical protein